jgi:hypothetical protein
VLLVNDNRDPPRYRAMQEEDDGGEQLLDPASRAPTPTAAGAQCLPDGVRRSDTGGACPAPGHRSFELVPNRTHRCLTATFGWSSLPWWMTVPAARLDRTIACGARRRERRWRSPLLVPADPRTSADGVDADTPLIPPSATGHAGATEREGPSSCQQVKTAAHPASKAQTAARRLLYGRPG